MVIRGQGTGPRPRTRQALRMSGDLDGEGEGPRDQGSDVSDRTVRPSLDLATGAESRALTPFPNVSRSISMGVSGSPN